MGGVEVEDGREVHRVESHQSQVQGDNQGPAGGQADPCCYWPQLQGGRADPGRPRGQRTGGAELARVNRPGRPECL